jgi:D-3-phosphoglycerate dehydrogenase / 2-oxoglutarate reductase
MKVLITDDVDNSLIAKLKKVNFSFDYFPEIQLNEIKKIIHQYEIIVINTKTVMDREMIDLAFKLQLIIRLGSGLEIIDLEYASIKGIKVVNTPEGNRQAVAEHALGLLLALMNNIAKSNYQVKNFEWNRESNRGLELNEKTIGIIGFGNTGSSFARVLSGFDVKILAYDKYKQRFAEDFRNVKETVPEEIFECSDIVSFHVPLTAETVLMGNMNFFKKFKKDIYIINTSRGKVIKTIDLISALKSGKVKGAGLDVLENEKPSMYSDIEKEMYSELFSFDNLIITPHIAGWTKESKEKIAELVFENIVSMIL